PPNSGWVNRIPVSMMYAVTPAPVSVYVTELLSGRFRWSIRSRPQVTGLSIASAVYFAVRLDVVDDRQPRDRGGGAVGQRRGVSPERMRVDELEVSPEPARLVARDVRHRRSRTLEHHDVRALDRRRRGARSRGRNRKQERRRGQRLLWL